MNLGLRFAAVFLLAALLTACSGSNTSSVSKPSPAPAGSPAPRATMPVPTGVPATPASAPSLATIRGIAGEVVDAMAKGDFTSPQRYFEPGFKAQLSPSALQQAWQSLVTSAGPYQRQTGSHIEKQDDNTVVSITCQFEKLYYAVQVAFNGANQIVGMRSTPDAPYEAPPYVKQDAFSERDVTVGGGAWALPGTLSLPSGVGPFPAVVLVQGMGPHDRDESAIPNRPFRDLAWGLASRGIAVLRYDKRTKVYPSKLQAQEASFTAKDEVTDDAVAAVALLRQTPGIDARQIFVVGHDLGGMLVPRIAAADPSIAGFVLLAAPSRPLPDVILDQYQYVAEHTPEGDAGKAAKDALETVKQQVQAATSPSLSASTPASKLPLNLPASYWLDLRDYHPAEAAKAMTAPMLILQGERDYNSTMADFQGWKDALSSRPNVEFKSYPTLDHLFIAGTGPITVAEYTKPGHVDESVIADISAWITKS